jgi:hypothetical protein
MKKFHGNDKEILEWMLAEERIKNWGENLGDEDGARRKNLNFWRKMNVFFPKLEEKLNEQNFATAGMLHRTAEKNLENFCKNSKNRVVFIGFNAFTPVEEKLVRTLLQWDKADVFFKETSIILKMKGKKRANFLESTKLGKNLTNLEVLIGLKTSFLNLKI